MASSANTAAMRTSAGACFFKPPRTSSSVKVRCLFCPCAIRPVFVQQLKRLFGVALCAFIGASVAGGFHHEVQSFRTARIITVSAGPCDRLFREEIGSRSPRSKGLDLL